VATIKAITLLALAGVGGAAALWQAPAAAHSWYPLDCCSGEDCAPVENTMWVVPAGGGTPRLAVTSKHGTAIVPVGFPVRVSRDDHMHVCMQFDPFGAMEVICLFMPRVLS
jgi:hypothetical protein